MRFPSRPRDLAVILTSETGFGGVVGGGTGAVTGAASVTSAASGSFLPSAVVESEGGAEIKALI